MQLQQLGTLAILAVHATLIYCNELARGFNDDIKWVNLDDGLKQAEEQNKPLMVIIHKSWCGACKSLKPKFSSDKPIEELAKKFVMVNVMDDEEPKDKKYSPDGAYIPRILFFEPNGVAKTDIYNSGGNDKYKYYYHETTAIYKSMKKALGEETPDDRNEL